MKHHLIRSWVNATTGCGIPHNWNKMISYRLPEMVTCEECLASEMYEDVRYTIEIGFDGNKKAYIDFDNTEYELSIEKFAKDLEERKDND